MPVSLRRLPSGTLVLLKRCEVCDADASTGEGVYYRKALLALEAGDKAKAKQLLGRWYCGEHARERDGQWR
jgi:hypothetical protein